MKRSILISVVLVFFTIVCTSFYTSNSFAVEKEQQTEKSVKKTETDSKNNKSATDKKTKKSKRTENKVKQSKANPKIEKSSKPKEEKKKSGDLLSENVMQVEEKEVNKKEPENSEFKDLKLIQIKEKTIKEGKPENNLWEYHRNVIKNSALNGATGLVRVLTADASNKGVVRENFRFDYFKDNDFLIKGDDHLYMAGTLGIAATVMDFLEIWLSMKNYANRNNMAETLDTIQLMQTLGDFDFGIKLFIEIEKSLTIGFATDLDFYPGDSDSAFNPSATGINTSFLLTWDVWKLNPRIPLRVHFNLVNKIDNTNAVEGIDMNTLNRIEEFSLRIRQYNSFFIGLALEAPLPYATPFLEYSADIAYVVKGDDFDKKFKFTINDNNSPKAESRAAKYIFPEYIERGNQRITPGVLLHPTDNVSILIALEIGLTPQLPSDHTAPLTYFAKKKQEIIDEWGDAVDEEELDRIELDIKSQRGLRLGIESIPPYMFFLGVSYHFGWLTDEQKETKIIEKIMERKVEVKVEEKKVLKGKIAGQVLDSQSHTPISGVIISFNKPGLPPISVEPNEGRFITYDLEPGELELAIRATGYNTLIKKVLIKSDETMVSEYLLTVSEQKAMLTGVVKTTDNKPLIADVILTDTKGVEIKLRSKQKNGEFIQELTKGFYKISIKAEGYKSYNGEINLKRHNVLRSEYILHSKDLIKEEKASVKKIIIKNIKIVKNKIEVSKKIHFQIGTSKVQIDSLSILDEVVEILKQNMHINKLRIEGHTDNEGAEKVNKKLSQKRAESVMNYLVEKGISSDRLEALGFGSEKPLASNRTKRGRSSNRRVEFTIIEQ